MIFCAISAVGIKWLSVSDTRAPGAVIRGGATDTKMVRRNRGAAGADASAEGTTSQLTRGSGEASEAPAAGYGAEPQLVANFVHFICYFTHSEA